MRRRDLLKLLATAPYLLRSTNLFAEGAPRWDRIVVLIELKGANDSLNTVIPYQDPLYYQYRPTIALARDKVLPLGEQLAWHPALRPLLPLWEKKQIALVHGLGYANPSLSHYRSSEIWNTGSDSATVLRDGWITRCFERHPLPNKFTASGIALSDDLGPLDGIHSKSIVMTNPGQFLNRAELKETATTPVENPALAHIIEVQKAINAAPQSMFSQLIDENYLSQSPFKSNIDAQLSAVVHLIETDVANPVYKLSHGSFDTHSNQPLQHEQLLQQLAEALVNFQMNLQERGMWNRVVIMTYSEFGRSVHENAKHGTDHGTAASHFLLGGQVAGGHYGLMPALAELQDENLKFTTDFRRLYSTLIEKWWNLSAGSDPFSGFETLPLFNQI